MPINWTNVKKAKVSDRCFYGPRGHAENHHFEQATPEEALLMSRKGLAKGYDTVYRTEDDDYTRLVVEITHAGVQLLTRSHQQQEWINEMEAHPTRLRARIDMVHNWNWTSWDDLLPINREYLLSLLWIPEDPFTAMEILAKAASE
jgi:hypothetical protein